MPYIGVDPPLLADLLAPAFPGGPIESCELVTEGLVNSNYRVVVGGKTVLLRLYARDPAACGKEASLARRFGSVLPIPAVLHADSSCERLPHPYAVHEWVDGVRADDVVIAGEVAPVAEACGRLLARLQGIEFAAPGFLAEDLSPVDPVPLTPAFYSGWMREWVLTTSAADVLGDGLAERVIAWADARAPLVGAVGAERHLVHSDFNGANILMRRGPGGWEVAALLDWEFAFAGTSLFDVANMLRHYTLSGPDFAEPFLGAFAAAGGRLPGQWLDTARALDMMSLIGFLARPDCGATTQRDVLALICGYLAA